MAPDLVIFDCDGVLIDSETIGCGIEVTMLNEAGFAITPETSARRFLGRPTHEMIAEVEAEMGRSLPSDFAETYDSRVMDAYRTHLQAVPHVKSTLANAGWRYCVASSSGPSKLSLGLIETGLYDLFYPNIFSSTLVARGKPAPDLFLYAAQHMSADPSRCVVVEDSVAGIEAARAAGMRAVGFVGGTHCLPEHADLLLDAGAEGAFESFKELSTGFEATPAPRGPARQSRG